MRLQVLPPFLLRRHEYFSDFSPQRNAHDEREGARPWKRIKESGAVTEELRRELVGRNYQLIRAGLETKFVHAPCMTFLKIVCSDV
jgi:hypothetical protein